MTSQGSHQGGEPRRILALRRRIIRAAAGIRSKMSVLHGPVDRAKGSEVWGAHLDGVACGRIIIYLRSSGCSWALGPRNGLNGRIEFRAGCIDCEHSVADTTWGIPISTSDYITQFDSELQKYSGSAHPVLCVYNEGSFFNERELPATARREILRCVGHREQTRSLILESLPEYLNPGILEETVELLQGKHLEIGVGLESSNQMIRDLCVNKPYSLQQFDASMQLINQYADSLAYVLLKPSFLEEHEAVADAIATARYAFEHGAKCVSIEPVNVSEFNMAGTLARLGLFQKAWLWSVLEVAIESSRFGSVRIGGYQFAPAYRDHPSSCGLCGPRIQASIERFNVSGEVQVLKDISDCRCRAEWKKIMVPSPTPLLDRIEFAINAVEQSLGAQATPETGPSTGR